MKTKILRALESKGGVYVSGEEIANSLGVSRAAIWKAVSILRNEGYKISASTKKGYRLETVSDSLSVKGIRANLKKSTRVSEIILLNEIDSTNNHAKKMASAGCPDFTLVTADHQTAGRGRRGHSFESPSGTGLYMSMVLRPKTDIDKFQMITTADAVAVCLAIEDLYPSARGRLGIKWVNDVFMDGKKICGILTEALTGVESGEVESVVTGIGVNVASRKFSAEVSQIAGSIFGENDEILFSRNELCARIADYVADFADNLSDPVIIQAYRQRSILTGHDISYMRNDEKFYGHVDGIDDTGGLVVRNHSGKIETLRSGEVHMVRGAVK